MQVSVGALWGDYHRKEKKNTDCRNGRIMADVNPRILEICVLPGL
jgi:hypothetical protein